MKRTYTKSSPYGQTPFPGQTVKTGFELPSTVEADVQGSGPTSKTRYSRSGDVAIQQDNGHRVDSRAPFVSPSGTGATVRYDGHSSTPYARPFSLPEPMNKAKEVS